ncbi:MAG: transporter substrate-binding domain-containing protein, partial [Synergistaceae bacterium]|nr:transporter substrate-binding domain-containing protein [Synergistaceae bacterium]
MMKKIIMLALCFALMMSCAAVAEVKVAKVEDLKQAKIGVQAGSIAEALVHDLFDDNAENNNITAFETVFEVIEALKAKKIDAAVMDEAPARFFVTDDESLKIVPEPVQSEAYAIAFKKGSALVADVNKVLEEIINDGTLAMIISKYLDDFPSAGEIDFNKGAAGGQLWVGCAAGFPPYEMRNESGFLGIDIELSAEIAK